MFLNLMDVPEHSRTLILTDLSMKEEAVHDKTSEHVILAHKPSSIISLIFSFFYILLYPSLEIT